MTISYELQKKSARSLAIWTRNRTLRHDGPRGCQAPPAERAGGGITWDTRASDQHRRGSAVGSRQRIQANAEHAPVGVYAAAPPRQIDSEAPGGRTLVARDTEFA